MRRSAALAERRRMLLARCEMQRLELSARLLELRHEPRRRAQAALAEAGAAGASLAARHPLWIVALAGLALFGRKRPVLSLLVWLNAAVSVASRGAQLLKLVGGLRKERTRPAPP